MGEGVSRMRRVDRPDGGTACGRADNGGMTAVLVAHAGRSGGTKEIAEAVQLLTEHEEALRHRPVWLFHSGPCGPLAAGKRVSLPAGVALLAARIDAERTATFGGRLTPATASGLFWKIMAAGPWAGDFR